LKAREDGGIRWSELLEKFKNVQDKAKRAKGLHGQIDDQPTALNGMLEQSKEKSLQDSSKYPGRPLGAEGSAPRSLVPQHKPKSSLGNFSRLARGVAGQKKK